jgi:hypothetical protein
LPVADRLRGEGGSITRESIVIMPTNARWAKAGAAFSPQGSYATAYLICKIARPDLQVPETSKFIFGEDERSAGTTVRESALALGVVNAR